MRLERSVCARYWGVVSFLRTLTLGWFGIVRASSESSVGVGLNPAVRGDDSVVP